MRPALVLFMALFAACGSAPATFPPPPVVRDTQASADLELGRSELSMEIIELMCSPCAAQIVSQSRQLPGVTKVSMVLATKTLIVQFDPGLTARDAIIASVEDIVANIQ